MKHGVSMFHLCFIYVSFMFQRFIFWVFRYKSKTSMEKNQNMLEEKSKDARSDFKTCSKRCDWNIEIKAETSVRYVSVLQLIDYQYF